MPTSETKSDFNSTASSLNRERSGIAATDAELKQPAVTLFTVPKPFGEDPHIDRIQRNALNSWVSLDPLVEVVVLGDEPGIESTAKQLNARHVPGLQYNDWGTPLVSSAFELAAKHSSTPWLAYCNSDVVLLSDFAESFNRLVVTCQLEQFVGFGRRIDLQVEEDIDFFDPASVRRLVAKAQKLGQISSQVCKEYFVFNRDLFATMPEFAIGRGNWDNWMIHHAKSQQVPVINLSQTLTAIHQSHDYRHTDSDRMSCYVSGPEARQNQSLAGGRHLVSGSVGTHRLTKSGLARERRLLLNPAFWADVPRFLKLVSGLLSRRQ
jgi:hypothetical protein